MLVFKKKHINDIIKQGDGMELFELVNIYDKFKNKIDSFWRLL